MSLLLTEEEEALQEAVREFVAARSPITTLRALIESGEPYDAGVWQLMSGQLGLTGLVIPAEHGGAEAGYSALSVALTELGAGLVSSPLLAGTLAAAALVRLGDNDAQKDLLPGIASGQQVVTLAALSAGAVTASGDTLTGEIGPVLNAGQAGVVLVPAQDGTTTKLYAVSAGAPGLTVSKLHSIDHSRSVGQVSLAGTPARALAGDATAALGFAADVANLALAAEQIGGMRTCLEMTTEYARIRVAFGLPIGSFQGVKHRLANIRVSLELAYAALRDAAWAADERPADFAAAAAVARVMASDAYREAATATIQLHGGIGFTWEHDAHFYYKNALSQRALLGEPGEQLDRLRLILAG